MLGRELFQRWKALRLDERVLVVLLLATLLFGFTILLVTLNEEFAHAATQFWSR